LSIRHTLLCASTFSFSDRSTTAIYTLSLHDALPISEGAVARAPLARRDHVVVLTDGAAVLGQRPDHDQHARRARRRRVRDQRPRSEEHTSELQSPDHLVCRLLLEKKKKTTI